MQSYHDKSSSKYITYLDSNNLYGLPMSHLHKFHNVYLLAPEKLEISHNIVSNYCK